MKQLTLSVAILTALVACKNTRKVASPQPPAPQTPATAAANTEKNGAVARVIVSFISRGAGTSPDAKKAFQNYVADFSKRYERTVSADTVRWGREGEVDYCLQLSNFDLEEQRKFVDGLKQALANVPLVNMTENRPCRTPRSRQ